MINERMISARLEYLQGRNREMAQMVYELKRQLGIPCHPLTDLRAAERAKGRK